ncbi:MAG: leucine-rich repeat domain-containing protein [Aureispira sp.]|nr:leucine-rich repeat domain-containing protein [Aureispira sp.]
MNKKTTDLHKIQELIKSGSRENIDLAFLFAKSEGIAQEDIMIYWKELISFARAEKDSPQNTLFHLLNLTELDLGNCGISSVPEQISLLINLVDLNLESNSITRLPENISLLPNVESLNLQDNPLSCLPQNINSLSKLNDLYLQDTLIESLPENFVHLSNLREVYLYNSPICENDMELIKQNLPLCEFFIVEDDFGDDEEDGYWYKDDYDYGDGFFQG